MKKLSKAMKYFSKAMILAGFIILLNGIVNMSLCAGSKQDKNKKASDDSVDVYVSCFAFKKLSKTR